MELGLKGLRMRRRILMVLYYYPPIGSIGMMRTLRIARRLPDLGWEPLILTVSEGTLAVISCDSAEGELDLGWVFRSRNPDIEFRLKSLLGFDVHQHVDTVRYEEAGAGLKLKARAARWAGDWNVPDRMVDWLPFARRTAIDICRTFSPSVLFSSSPPATCHLIAASTKKKVGLPWMADMRDPWTTKVNERRAALPANFTDDDCLLKEEQQRLHEMCLRARHFRSRFKTVPIVAFVGPKGGTKTSTLRREGVALFGPDYDVTVLANKQDDFAVVAGQSYYLVLDNVDTRVPWLNDCLAVMATGGKMKKRTLYTDKDVTEIGLEGWVLYTSRETHSNRDDVADRTLPFHTSRLGTFVPERTVIAETVNMRDEIMTYRFKQCQKTLMAFEAAAQKGGQFTTKFRLADFAEFCMAIADHEDFHDEMKLIFAKMSNEQDEFVFANDPLLDLLFLWVPINQGL